MCAPPLSSSQASPQARADELYLRAVELPPDARAEFLDRECADDPELKAELLSLLRYDSAEMRTVENAMAACAAFVVHSETAGSENRNHTAVLPLHAEFAPGSFLGPYRIVRELGRGGMGVVYLANRDDGEFSREVALKVVQGVGDVTSLLARLRVERQILASLNHPNIAKLLDGGRTPGGAPYLALEYIDGLDIRTYCDRNSLGVEARCGLVEQVADAIAYAHRNLVIHRDLKPGNILVPATGTPQVLDFGIAKLLIEDAVSDTVESPTAWRAFSPGYASPEQRAGLRVGTSTDVYSLGVILHLLLTGVLPPTGSEDDQDPVPLPSTTGAANGRSPAHVRTIRGDLDNILQKALRRDPADRYLSMEQFQDDLVRFRKGFPVLARPDSAVYRFRKLIRRNRFSALATAFAALALAAGITISLWQAHVARLERTAAERRFQQVRELAGRITGDFYDSLADVPGTTPARKQLVETGVRYYDSLLAESAGDQELLKEIARGYDRLGDALGSPVIPSLGDLNGAAKNYKKAAAIRKTLHDESPAFAAEKYADEVRLARIDYFQTRASEARRNLARVIREIEQSGHGSDRAMQEVMAEAWSIISVVAPDEDPAKIDAGRRALRIAEAVFQSAGGTDDAKRMLARFQAQFAYALSRVVQNDEAKPLLRSAISLNRSLFEKNPNSAWLLNTLYVNHLFLANDMRGVWSGTQTPLEEFRQVLEQMDYFARRLVDRDPGNANVWLRVSQAGQLWGVVLADQHDYVGSVAKLDEAVAAQERAVKLQPGNKTSGMLADILVIRAQSLGYLARVAEAETDLRRADKIYQQMEASEPGSFGAPTALNFFDGRGQLYVLKRNWAAALADLEHGLRLNTELQQSAGTLRVAQVERIELQSNLAKAYKGLGRTAQYRSALQGTLTALSEVEKWRPLTEKERALRTETKAHLSGSRL
jgi:serine/threonine protein kinase